MTHVCISLSLAGLSFCSFFLSLSFFLFLSLSLPSVSLSPCLSVSLSLSLSLSQSLSLSLFIVGKLDSGLWTKSLSFSLKVAESACNLDSVSDVCQFFGFICCVIVLSLILA